MTRYVLPVVLGALSWAAPSHAKEFHVERKWAFAARAEALAAGQVDYDHACSKGCVHKVPRLTQAVVLPQSRTADAFYVWMFVEDTQNSKWFSQVTIRRDGQKIHVDIRAVAPDVAASLAKASGKPNDPAFDQCVTTFDFEEVFDGDRFKETRVRFVSSVSISGLGAIFGGGIVDSRLAEAAHATYEDLAKTKPEPPNAH